MEKSFTESNYENAVLQLFLEQLGYNYVYGPDVERDYHDPLYEAELLPALQRINRDLPEEAIAEAVYKLKNFESGTLLQKNMVFTDYLQNGVPVKYAENGEERSTLVYLVDFQDPDNNDFTIANQWTVVENSEKRPDVILFVNGLPLVVVELKSPSREETDGKGGVFWHTQGSGKSLSMVFYAHYLQEALESPTIVVIIDRNDLDDQLYGQFARCRDFLRQTPVQATCRKLSDEYKEKMRRGETPKHIEIGLKDWLKDRQANGIIFTTMQKFEESREALSQRRNIIVMADEAHRGQYGLTEKVVTRQKDNGELEVKTVIGTARIIRDSLPNATYIGFTGTPISSKDRSTREVFGDYIDIYDMTQAVEDGATRPVYYESRVIHLNLDQDTLQLIDAEYDLMAQNADPYVIEKSKKELGQMEAILGADTTIESLVNDILDHYENYRANLLTGKAMVVAYSRPLAMKIYNQILKLRPAWTEKVAVVMTQGNNDPEEWREVIGNKAKKEELARQFKNNESPLKIAIVVDMWLTGFDVPSLATMYVYKPMSGHNLMQAIARVNRVFHDKEGGWWWIMWELPPHSSRR